MAQTLYRRVLYGANIVYQYNEYRAYSSAINASNSSVIAGSASVTPLVQLYCQVCSVTKGTERTPDASITFNASVYVPFENSRAPRGWNVELHQLVSRTHARCCDDL